MRTMINPHYYANENWRNFEMWWKNSQNTRYHKEILHCTEFSLTYKLFPSFSREAMSSTILKPWSRDPCISVKREIQMGWWNVIKRKRQKNTLPEIRSWGDAERGGRNEMETRREMARRTAIFMVLCQ